MTIPDVNMRTKPAWLPWEVAMKAGRAADEVQERLVLIASRDIDRVAIRDMLSVGLIEDQTAEQLPPELRPRLEEIRADPDG